MSEPEPGSLPANNSGGSVISAAPPVLDTANNHDNAIPVLVPDEGATIAIPKKGILFEKSATYFDNELGTFLNSTSSSREYFACKNTDDFVTMSLWNLTLILRMF